MVFLFLAIGKLFIFFPPQKVSRTFAQHPCAWGLNLSVPSASRYGIVPSLGLVLTVNVLWQLLCVNTQQVSDFVALIT